MKVFFEADDDCVSFTSLKTKKMLAQSNMHLVFENLTKSKKGLRISLKTTNNCNNQIQRNLSYLTSQSGSNIPLKNAAGLNNAFFKACKEKQIIQSKL